MTLRTHLALLSGAALYAAALPPFDWSWCAWFALVPLIALAGRTTPGRALRLGAIAGFYTAWTVTWWLPQAVAAYFQASLLMGVATISVAYVLAISTTFAIFAWTVATLRERPAPLRFLGLAATWTAVELLRARGLADPWALLGYTQYQHVGLIQIASLTGVYGVSFLVALGNLALVGILDRRPTDRARGWVIATGVGAVAVAWIGGATIVGLTRLDEPSVRVAVVQPGIAPAHTWTRGYAERQLATTLALQDRLMPGDIDLVVWPENSVTLYPEQEPFVRRAIERAARPHRVGLLIGSPRYDGGRGVFNSARLIGADGRWTSYDKQRLVPFAEAPVGFADAPAHADPSPRHFRAGSDPGVLGGALRIGVSICHELLYPETIHPSVSAGAELLVNVANDGWLDGGYGVASRQHFAMGVLRAVESRRYLVRAATGGVSGAADPFGRILARTDPDAATVFTVSIAPGHGITWYVRWGDWFPLACAAFVAFALATVRRPAIRPAATPVAQSL